MTTRSWQRTQRRSKRWLISLCVLCFLCVSTGGCRRNAPPPPLTPQVSGTAVVPGLTAPVRVVRDRWGVPHLYAQTQDDLFAAQGFVQAEDRLFQLDLWRRSSQGRLSQVLGPNFVERDAMTRRVQYAGPLDVEWASYGADTKSIASAFVRGINAWVELARERPPEEFVRAGWKPEFWNPADVLNRTDAFTASGDAIDEIRRRGLSEVVADAVRRVGTAPFFATSFHPDAAQLGVASASRAMALANSVVMREAAPELQSPSVRYAVHLHAPGWNTVGFTAPWRPGVAAGHNDRIAWAETPIDVDTQDIYAEPDATPKTSAAVPIVIKGRLQPFVFSREATARGVVIASDREHHLVYTIRWSGTEPGAAPELAALAIDRAADWPEFRAAAARWKMPARRIVYADRDGRVGFQDAALVPLRRGTEWRGWISPDALPHAFDPHGGEVGGRAPSHTRAAAPQALFAHVLGITDAARERFNIGPLPRPSDDSQVQLAIDMRDWDRSTAINAPGQSGSPSTVHFSDLAAMWARGQAFPLVFSDAAVEANAESTLMLVPAGKP